MKDVGVYQIENTVNGKVYVGSSTCLKRRFKAHRNALLAGRHHSAKLQRSWDKYGEAAFEFLVLLNCAKSDVLLYEQFLLDAWKPHEVGYNMSPTAGSCFGFKPSAENVANMRAAGRAQAKKYQWKGAALCIVEIAELEGVSMQTLCSRVLDNGWTMERAVATPVRARRRSITAMNRTQSTSAWAKELGLSTGTLLAKLSRGCGVEDLVGRRKSITVGELARLSGVNPQLAHCRIRRGWSVRDALAVDAGQSGRPKLTADIVLDIRRSGEPGIALAAKYGITPSTVSDIRTKNTWRNVV
jgi:hypothetical protein